MNRPSAPVAFAMIALFPWQIFRAWLSLVFRHCHAAAALHIDEHYFTGLKAYSTTFLMALYFNQVEVKVSLGSNVKQTIIGQILSLYYQQEQPKQQLLTELKVV